MGGRSHSQVIHMTDAAEGMRHRAQAAIHREMWNAAVDVAGKHCGQRPIGHFDIVGVYIFSVTEKGDECSYWSGGSYMHRGSAPTNKRGKRYPRELIRLSETARFTRDIARACAKNLREYKARRGGR